MKALVFHKSVPRYALLKLFGSRLRRLATGSICPLSLRDVPPPRLPDANWVRIAPRLSGICGSDLATIFARGSPYLAPLISMPFVMGHEIVGTIAERGSAVTDLDEGDSVVLRPALGCAVRAMDPPCEQCRSGQDALCRHVTRGIISAGIQTGYCRDTGGGFGENLVAHRSQVYRVPDDLDDRAAVLIEPFACALHGALKAGAAERERIVVIGCGAVGLLTIAGLRAIGCRARIFAVAKHAHQRHHAEAIGADVILSTGRPWTRRYGPWAEELEAEIHKSEIGRPAVVGGADVTFDCVASSGSIDDALRFTRSGGTVVLVGMPGMPVGVDWTPMWYKELTVRAAYAYGPERFGGATRDTFALAVELMPTWAKKLSPLVGAPYPLEGYRAALTAAGDTGRSGAVKTVFAANSHL